MRTNGAATPPAWPALPHQNCFVRPCVSSVFDACSDMSVYDDASFAGIPVFKVMPVLVAFLVFAVIPVFMVIAPVLAVI